MSNSETNTHTAIAVGVMVTVVGGVIVAFIAQEGRFDPARTNPTPTQSQASSMLASADGGRSQYESSPQHAATSTKLIEATATSVPTLTSVPSSPTARPATATSVPTFTSVPSSPTPRPRVLPTQRPDCRWAIQLTNATDPGGRIYAYLNGRFVAGLPDSNGIFQDSDWVDLSPWLTSGDENRLRVTVDGSSATTWGIKIRRSDEIVVDLQNDGAVAAIDPSHPLDRSYRLTSACSFRELVPSSDTWILEVGYSNWMGVGIVVDGVGVASLGGRDGTTSVDLSGLILKDEREKVVAFCSDMAPMNGSGAVTYSLKKNGNVILTRSLSEYSGCNLEFYILPNGRVSLDGK